MRGVVDQALHEQASVSSNHRGARNPVIRRQPSKGAIAKPSKKRSKLPIYAVVCVALLVGVWFSLDRLKDEKILRNLASSDPDTLQPGAPAIDINERFIDEESLHEKSKYEDSLRNMTHFAKPHEDVDDGSSEDTLSGEGKIKQKSMAQRDKMTGEPILTGTNAESVEPKLVSNAPHPPSHLETSKSKSIFAEQDLKVYFVKVGHTYPRSARALDSDVPVIVMRDFRSKTPLTASDFGRRLFIR